MMLLRANAFASNYSGPRVELVERLLAFLNAGLHPVIPQRGSVGASGDLAPLAHMAGAVCGFEEAEMIYKGRRMPAREAIAEAGFDPDFELGAKDASALINGSTTSLALGALATQRCAQAPEACRHRHVPVARGDARRAGRLRSARAPGPRRIPARRRSRATSCASSRARSAARKPPATSSSLTSRAQPGTPAPPARAGRLFAALHAAGPWAGGRGGRVCRAHHRHGDEFGHRQPAHLRRRTGRLRLDLGRPFPRQYVAQAMDVLAIAIADLGSISRAPPRAPRRPHDVATACRATCSPASAASTPASPRCNARCRRS